MDNQYIRGLRIQKKSVSVAVSIDDLESGNYDKETLLHSALRCFGRGAARRLNNGGIAGFMG